ncbi:anthocyanidin 3-O-glucosyltransferase 7-like [Curcuma longa]|uniref:anthocyanidin 3-O-glucosyltransferase 7-like n=1 Tax=Curcuma longa TaxID=136217 RepID=UPI003D9F797E
MASAHSCASLPLQTTSHVVLVAFPFGTHAAPLLALARCVAAAAPSTTLSFISTPQSLASLPPVPAAGNIQLVPISDGVPYEADPPLSEQEKISMFLAMMPGSLRAALDAAVKKAGGAAVSCVVSDAFLWMAGEEAEAAGVPWVPLWTGGPASLLAHRYTDLLRDTIGTCEQATARQDELLGPFIPALSVHRVRDLPDGVVSGPIGSPFARLLHRMGKSLPNAAVVLLNTVCGLDGVIDAELKANIPHPLHVGPLHLLASPPALANLSPDINGCLSWLDLHAPASVAYVSFGSVMTPAPAELAELAQGMEASGAPFLWALKDQARELLPQGFLERTRVRGLVVSWAPQQDVLRHAAVGAFITHCGWNSVLEAMASGVPMICRPFFGDQMLNARTLSLVWGIGVGFEGGSMTKEGVVAALETVLKSEEGKRMKAKAGELKATVAKAVHHPDGSSQVNFNKFLAYVIN